MISEQYFSTERSGESQLYVEIGINNALAHIAENFEHSSKGLENLPFHNTDHTRQVMRRTQLILSTISSADPTLVSSQDMLLGQLAAAFHDSEQKWKNKKVKTGNQDTLIRERYGVGNEVISCANAVNYMVHVNETEGKDIFSKDDIETVVEAILVTIPVFDLRHQTVAQPNLSNRTSLVARAVALADLGSAGLDGLEMVKEDSKKLFREENLDITIRLSEDIPLTKDEESFYKDRYLKWVSTQYPFAKGRKDLLTTELDGIPQHVLPYVERLFNKFDETLAGLENITASYAALEPKELLVEVGYHLQ